MDNLSLKVDRAIKLIRSVVPNGECLEVAYSGGKDSDVLLHLVRSSGVNFRPIYKNTTIDPPGTITHVRSVGAEVFRPRFSFFELISQKGFPSRYTRFCCDYLKEYKVLGVCAVGVRRCESVARSNRYFEPVVCRFFGSKKNFVQHVYPLLDWSDKDILEYITSNNIECHPLYYDNFGVFHVERRLGCLCCPLASRSHRISEFKQYPNMVRAYIRYGYRYMVGHPDTKFSSTFDSVYDGFVYNLFFDNYADWYYYCHDFFGMRNSKNLLEDMFNISL